MCKAFPSLDLLKGSSLDGFRDPEGNGYLVSHPLWSSSQPRDGLVHKACEEHGLDPSRTRMVNSFDLSRRMAWCWKKRDSGEFPFIDLQEAGDLPSEQPAPPAAMDLPPGDWFEFEDPPRGMPQARLPRFKLIPVDEAISRAKIYLVRNAEGELVVGRIDTHNDSEGHTLLRFRPADHSTGVTGFDAERENIVARIAGEEEWQG